MASGRCVRIADLPAVVRGVLDSAERAVMTTVDPDGYPHTVPVVFAIDDGEVVTPIDRKPKTGKKLRRVRNLERDPRATLLVDRWSEEWTELAWVMIRGRASLHAADRSFNEIEKIITRYPEYRDTIQGSDVIRIVPERISWWSWS